MMGKIGKAETNEYFQILALDGGGVKGLYTAALLSKLEEDLGVNITDHFDLITGTSTGGLIALGLGLGMAPSELTEFYIQSGRKIFSQIPFISWCKHWIKKKYNTQILAGELKLCFREQLLGDSAKRLVITSYDLGNNDVHLLKTPHHPRLTRDLKIPIWKVALATTAAPTYFAPCKEIDNLRLIDGGIWANNPSLVGLTEAISLLQVPLEKIKVMSIGTSYDFPQRKKYLDWGGKLLWTNSAVELICRSQSESIHKQMSLILTKDRYERVNPLVPDNIFDMDKLTLQELQALAAKDSRTFSPTFSIKFANHIAPKYQPYLKEQKR